MAFLPRSTAGRSLGMSFFDPYDVPSRDQTLSAAPTFQPFKFEPRRARLDWRLLHGVDVNDMIRDVDLDTLEKIVSIVAFGDIEAEDTRHLTELNFIKVFRLSQLMVEYLLYVQDCLQTTNAWLQQDRANMDKYVNAARIRIRELESGLKLSKREARRARNTVKTYEMMASAGKIPHGDTGIFSTGRMEQSQSHAAMESLLRKDLAGLSERLSRAQVESAQLRSERDEMFQHIRDIDTAMRANRNVMVTGGGAGSMSQFQSKLGDGAGVRALQEQLSKAQHDARRARSEVDQLQTEVVKAAAERRQLVADREKLLQEVVSSGRLGNDVSQSAGGSSQLSVMLMEAEQRTRQVEGKLAESQAEVSALQKQLMKAMKDAAGTRPPSSPGASLPDLEGMQRAVQSAEATNRQLEGAIANLERELDSRKRAHADEVHNLRGELDLVQGQAVASQRQLADARSKIMRLDRTAQAAAASPQRSPGGLQRVDEREASHELMQEIQALRARNTNAEVTIESLNHRLRLAHAERQALAADLARHGPALDQARGSPKDSAQEGSITRGWKGEEMTQLRSRIAELEERLCERDATIMQLQETIRQLQPHLSAPPHQHRHDQDILSGMVRQQVGSQGRADMNTVSSQCGPPSRKAKPPTVLTQTPPFSPVQIQQIEMRNDSAATARPVTPVAGATLPTIPTTAPHVDGSMRPAPSSPPPAKEAMVDEAPATSMCPDPNQPPQRQPYNSVRPSVQESAIRKHLERHPPPPAPLPTGPHPVRLVLNPEAAPFPVLSSGPAGAVPGMTAHSAIRGRVMTAVRHLRPEQLSEQVVEHLKDTNLPFQFDEEREAMFRKEMPYSVESHADVLSVHPHRSQDLDLALRLFKHHVHGRLDDDVASFGIDPAVQMLSETEYAAVMAEMQQRRAGRLQTLDEGRRQRAMDLREDLLTYIELRRQAHQVHRAAGGVESSPPSPPYNPSAARAPSSGRWGVDREVGNCGQGGDGEGSGNGTAAHWSRASGQGATTAAYAGGGGGGSIGASGHASHGVRNAAPTSYDGGDGGVKYAGSAGTAAAPLLTGAATNHASSHHMGYGPNDARIGTPASYSIGSGAADGHASVMANNGSGNSGGGSNTNGCYGSSTSAYGNPAGRQYSSTPAIAEEDEEAGPLVDGHEQTAGRRDVLQPMSVALRQALHTGQQRPPDPMLPTSFGPDHAVVPVQHQPPTRGLRSDLPVQHEQRQPPQQLPQERLDTAGSGGQWQRRDERDDREVWGAKQLQLEERQHEQQQYEQRQYEQLQLPPAAGPEASKQQGGARGGRWQRHDEDDDLGERPLAPVRSNSGASAGGRQPRGPDGITALEALGQRSLATATPGSAAHSHRGSLEASLSQPVPRMAAAAAHTSPTPVPLSESSPAVSVSAAKTFNESIPRSRLSSSVRDYPPVDSEESEEEVLQAQLPQPKGRLFKDEFDEYNDDGQDTDAQDDGVSDFDADIDSTVAPVPQILGSAGRLALSPPSREPTASPTKAQPGRQQQQQAAMQHPVAAPQAPSKGWAMASMDKPARLAPLEAVQDDAMEEGSIHGFNETGRSLMSQAAIAAESRAWGSPNMSARSPMGSNYGNERDQLSNTGKFSDTIQSMRSAGDDVVAARSALGQDFHHQDTGGSQQHSGSGGGSYSRQDVGGQGGGYGSQGGGYDRQGAGGAQTRGVQRVSDDGMSEISDIEYA